jgi:hypothetical protein
MDMEKPDLDRIWQTWIRVMPMEDFHSRELLPIISKTIREKISVFSQLLKDKKLEWYCFLHHEFPKDPDNFYFHVRFTKAAGWNISLPDFCSQPQIEKVGNAISGIDKSLLRKEAIEEAWRIIGEQSELIVKLVQIHKDEIPIQQFIQFMHYNMSMVGLEYQGEIKVKHGITHQYLRF